MNLQIEAAMVRVFISLNWYGGVETDNFAVDFETLVEAKMLFRTIELTNMI